MWNELLYQAFESIFYKYIYVFIVRISHSSLKCSDIEHCIAVRNSETFSYATKKNSNRYAVLHTFYRICFRERERERGGKGAMFRLTHWWCGGNSSRQIAFYLVCKRKKNITIFHSIFISFLCATKNAAENSTRTQSERVDKIGSTFMYNSIPKWSYNNVDEIMLIKSGCEKKGKASTATMTTTAAAKISTAHKIEVRCAEKFIVKILKWGQ